MTSKGDAKFKGKLTCVLKNDIRNWLIFMQAVESLKMFVGSFCWAPLGSFCWKSLLGSFCSKHIKFRWKCTEELCLMTLKRDANFEEKLTCALKNDTRNMVNFDPTLESLKICTLMGSFWPNYVLFEIKKYRGVICHYTEDRCKLWRKNFWFHKWHEEFGELHWSTQKS